MIKLMMIGFKMAKLYWWLSAWMTLTHRPGKSAS